MAWLQEEQVCVVYQRFFSFPVGSLQNVVDFSEDTYQFSFHTLKYCV